jgi:hypothetical protein
MLYFLTFLAGFIVGLATWLIWLGLRFASDLKAARDAVAHYHDGTDSPRDIAANKAVEDCKNRLRWQKRLNPEWLPPLVDEVPKLVREIAAIYHPEHPDPLLAPGLGQFSRAVHLAALDIADFLQTRSIGRLVDVSASTALKTWEMTHKIATHETMQSVGKWYKRLLPVWQVLKFKSPVTWAGVAVSNIAARTLQPALIDIVAKRAIDLYGGGVQRKPPAAMNASTGERDITIQDIS